MKKIVVTGANGLLGQNVIKQLEKRNDFKVYAFARGECRFDKLESTTYLEVDISNKTEVEVAMANIQPTHLIHAAAMTNVDQCEQDKEGCIKANIDGTQNLVNEALKSKAYFVNLSTDFVFDGENGPYGEEDEPNPISYYGWSKLESEKLVANSGLAYANVRTIIVYGVVDNMSRSNLVLWTKSSLEANKNINVINDQFRSPTWAGDLAWACIRLCELEKMGTYHISGSTVKSIVDWVREVVEYFNLDDSYITEVTSAELSQPAKRPLRTGFDISKAINDLDYSPKSFRQGIEKMMGLINSQKK